MAEVRDTRTRRSEPTVTVEPLDHLPRDCGPSCGARSIARGHRVKRRSRTCVSEAGSASTRCTASTPPRPARATPTCCATDVMCGAARPKALRARIEWRSAPSARLRTLPNILPRCARERSQSRQGAGPGPLLERAALRRHGVGAGAATVLRVFRRSRPRRTGEPMPTGGPAIRSSSPTFTTSSRLPGLSLTAGRAAARCAPDVNGELHAADRQHRRGGADSPGPGAAATTRRSRHCAMRSSRVKAALPLLHVQVEVVVSGHRLLRLQVQRLRPVRPVRMRPPLLLHLVPS
jgi:hypothetical protein